MLIFSTSHLIHTGNIFSEKFKIVFGLLVWCRNCIFLENQWIYQYKIKLWSLVSRSDREVIIIWLHYIHFLTLLVFFRVIFFLQAYCIGIVWRCYKFLTFRQQALRSTIHYIMPGEAGERQPEPDYSSLLPDYDTACAQAMKQTPPPSYQVGVSEIKYP